ncbi:hypothetical protein ACFE04_020099 [Oxalis oulophora]
METDIDSMVNPNQNNVHNPMIDHFHFGPPSPNFRRDFQYVDRQFGEISLGDIFQYDSYSPNINNFEEFSFVNQNNVHNPMMIDQFHVDPPSPNFRRDFQYFDRQFGEISLGDTFQYDLYSPKINFDEISFVNQNNNIVTMVDNFQSREYMSHDHLTNLDKSNFVAAYDEVSWNIYGAELDKSIFYAADHEVSSYAMTPTDNNWRITMKSRWISNENSFLGCVNNFTSQGANLPAKTTSVDADEVYSKVRKSAKSAYMKKISSNNKIITKKRSTPRVQYWTADEDRLLIKLVDKYGSKNWARIDKMMQVRSGKQCRERWYNHLKPNIKKDEWSDEEDKALIRAHKDIGSKWAKIAKIIPGRTESSVKNHWNATMRRQFSTDKPKYRYRPPKSSFLLDYIKTLNVEHPSDTDKYSVTISDHQKPSSSNSVCSTAIPNYEDFDDILAVDISEMKLDLLFDSQEDL